MFKTCFVISFIFLFTGVGINEIHAQNKDQRNADSLSKTTYTIQFAALNDTIQQFQKLAQNGNLNYEYLPTNKLYRHKLGPFNSLEVVDSIINYLHQIGSYTIIWTQENDSSTKSAEIPLNNQPSPKSEVTNIQEENHTSNPSIKNQNINELDTQIRATNPNNTASIIPITKVAGSKELQDKDTIKLDALPLIEEDEVPNNLQDKDTIILDAPSLLSKDTRNENFQENDTKNLESPPLKFEGDANKKLQDKDTIILDSPPILTEDTISKNNRNKDTIELKEKLAKDSADSKSSRETPENIKKFAIVFTGKSLGVLGNIRFQEEHDLATEYAIEKDVEFKLVSHRCWRAKGLSIFLPSDEPKDNDLYDILAKKDEWDTLQNQVALVTRNTLMFQDPDRPDFNMLSIIGKNARTSMEFPELRKERVTLYRTTIDKKEKDCFIVEEEGAIWPSSIDHWSESEVNRIDFGKIGRLYELPFRKGNFGSRATLIKNLDKDLKAENRHAIKVDLGHRNGYFDVSHFNRLNVDIAGLEQLGYSILVPFEYELSLMLDSLLLIKNNHPGIKWLATNLRSRNDTIFETSLLIEKERIKIGFIGLVDPELEINLAGKILQDISFQDVFSSAQDAVRTLAMKKPDCIVALSNMSPDMNALLKEKVKGIDIITSDFSDKEITTLLTKEIKIPNKSFRNLASPAHITQNYDYGIALGKIDLDFDPTEKEAFNSLRTIGEMHYEVSDLIIPDTALVNELTSSLQQKKLKKGDLMIPAFIDITEQEPDLKEFDAVTKNGRMSKELWEKFLANLLRSSAPAEISIIRPVNSFLPLIGKLHEREVRSWLWFEDEIVMVDMKGRDIKRFLETDHDHKLITSGIEAFPFRGRIYWTVMGRNLLDDAYYRVATTNIISKGAKKEYFQYALRKSDRFTIDELGKLKEGSDARPVQFRDYVISELKRIRSLGGGKKHHKRIAQLLSPEKKYENLLSFNFIKPTLWSSINRNYTGDGYESIPESRVTSNNTFVVGVNGGFVMTLDAEKSAWDMGINFAFAQQSAQTDNGTTQKTENMDDLYINLTYRYKGQNQNRMHPFSRLEYDSEFTATYNPVQDVNNPRQSILRSVIGISRRPSFKLPVFEIGATAENDFSNNHYQYGIQGRSMIRFPLNKRATVLYTLTNNFNYLFPTDGDTERELSLRYNMIHELTVPLIGDLSLSMAADLFAFRGKTELNKDLGMSMLTRVGVTYNRIWKPRYQSLF